MNKVELMGRLTRDPQITTTNRGNEELKIARYTLAVERRFARASDDQQTADFISCVAFGKGAEFAEKYCKQGTKLVVVGRIQTGSYTNKEGQKVYTTDVVIEEQEFAESKKTAEGGNNAPDTAAPVAPTVDDGGYDVPDSLESDLPFPIG